MTLSVEITFPLGRYHATPWDRHVNEGAIEWPPSPWRLARALYAVWKERMPHLDETNVLAALDAISAPPTYHLPPWTSSATRHYYPDAGFLPAPMKPSVDKVIDAFVAVRPDAPLIISWADTDLSKASLAALSSLVSGLPYLGRADSVCIATVTASAPANGPSTLAPADAGDLQIAVPARPLDPLALTVTTDHMRKQRLRRPPGMLQVPYPPPVEERPRSSSSSARASTTTTVNAAVFSVTGNPPPSSLLTVAVADLFLAAAKKQYTKLTGLNAPPVLTGHPVDSTERRTDHHQHAHVWPLPGRGGATQIQRLLVWAEEGFDAAAAAALGQVTELRLSKKPRHHGDDGRGERDSAGRPVVRGLLPSRLLLTQLGDIGDLAPDLAGRSAHWTCCTPFIPSHHQRVRRRVGERFGSYYKDFLIDQINRELSHRGHDARVVELGEVAEGARYAAAQRYRRYRLKQHLADAREAVWITIHLDQEVSGPLALGSLSHFGLGLFRPIE